MKVFLFNLQSTCIAISRLTTAIYRLLVTTKYETSYTHRGCCALGILESDYTAKINTIKVWNVCTHVIMVEHSPQSCANNTQVITNKHTINNQPCLGVFPQMEVKRKSQLCDHLTSTKAPNSILTTNHYHTISRNTMNIVPLWSTNYTHTHILTLTTVIYGDYSNTQYQISCELVRREGSHRGSL